MMQNTTVKHKFMHFAPVPDNGVNLKRLELFLFVFIVCGVMIAILLSSLNFIIQSKEMLVLTENHQVMTAIMIYIGDGKEITSPFTVTPYDKGVLAPYLQGNLSNSWRHLTKIRNFSGTI